ncbi:aspartyl-phosphate phosphatase Spo0E family protein [Bacillus sp. Marseille-P3661]|uniref:aspartyl-phosphate phosphatase Spo0E family protein n=1 Tax=Bacillus sp. Marseille-P3661 TaxID=1936234 RepID=UPI0015E16E72|nr:aspartyl-phosphate phosphatase Spo0E family protein [Bacillus sp. Marseille-P3661]
MLVENLSYRELIKEIEITRKNMVTNGLELGFTHEHTVTLSTKLDELLNCFSLYQK